MVYYFNLHWFTIEYLDGISTYITCTFWNANTYTRIVWVSAIEEYYSIYAYEFHVKTTYVLRLVVYKENRQQVDFLEKDDLEDGLNR